MKKIVSLVLALSMVLSMFTTAFAGTSIEDIKGTDYEAAVSALVELGVVEGYPDGTYRPDAIVTRAQMAKLLVVAAGLEPAANVAKGATNFSDVAANHWASGYINVAAQYGYINGYPDGRFAPEATVTYAEAVTMAIRVLGYKTVVEAKGTWPTNYIAKAQELKVLKDVKYKAYNDGAVRGNVALLIWNMLRTNMWDVNSENETDGLNYSKSGTMINKYFEDYTYTTVNFEDFTINDDGEVIVTLDDSEASEADKLGQRENQYKYEGNDFYTFVAGTEVEVLVNEDDETLLMMVATANDKLVDGLKKDIDEDYDEISGDAYDYAYTRVEKKKIAASTKLVVESEYVYDLDKSSKKSVKINDKAWKYDTYEDEVVIVNGERGTIKDIKEGDIVSKVTVNGDEVFYVVSCTEAKGKLTKIVEENYDNAQAGSYTIATVGDKKYVVAENATYVEDPKDEDEDAKDFDASTWNSDMKNEVVVLKLDFLGNIVAVEFDGNIGDDSDNYTAGFYAITANVEKDSSRTYTIGLENENGKDDYTFAKGTATQKAKAMYADDIDHVGTYAFVRFDNDGNIEELTLVANASYDDITFTSGEYKDGKYLEVTRVQNATFDEDDMEITGSSEFRMDVSEDVVVVTLIFDDKGTTKTTDDEYRVEFSEGTKAIKKLKNEEKVLVISDTDDTFAEAKYVVLFDEVSDREDNLFGKVDSVEVNKIGDLIITVIGENGEEEELIVTVPANTTAENYRDLLNTYAFVMYSTEENSDKELEFTLVTGLTEAQLTSGDRQFEGHGYVSEIGNGGKKAIVETTEGEREINTTKQSFKDTYEDYEFIIVNVSEDDDVDGLYNVDSFTTKEYNTITFKVGDRISVDETNKAFAVIRGAFKK